MHRAVPVLAATVGGLALLANFHSSPAAPHVATEPSPGSASSTVPAAAEPRSGPTTTTAPPTSNPAAPSTTASTGTRTVDGPVVNTNYGDVQVRVTLQGTHIVDVQALRLPSDRSRSARISQYAGPMLRQEALHAQSPNIDLVSGATYTSEGYAQSLQGALDGANR